MGYRNSAACVADLERSGSLIRIDQELSADLEIGSIQRRVYQAGGPALLFTRVAGCSFPMLGNLFGTPLRVALGMGREVVADLREIGKLLGCRIETVIGHRVDPDNVASRT